MIGDDPLSRVNGSESFFAGLTDEDLRSLLSEVDHRHVSAGDFVLRAGDVRTDIEVITAGTAEVFLTDAGGVERPLRVVGPGQSLGELSLFTDGPASASVRALTELDLLVIARADFHRLATLYPQLHRNVGAIVAERLTHANRRVLDEPSGTVTLLVDHGAPAILGDALAASLAWHTRTAVLLLDATDGAESDAARLPAPIPGVAVRYSMSSDRRLGPTSLSEIESLRASFAHVLVRVLPSGAAAVSSSRRLLLTSVSATVDDASCDYRIVAWDPSPARPGLRAGVVRVAAPTSDERVSISAGALSGRGPAGRTLGWIARDIAGLKVGLALGSGSVRGFAHIGVLRALERAGVPVDFLAGSSIGAPVAGMLAAGDEPDVILDKLRRVGTATFRPTVPRHAILSNQRVRDVMRGDWGERRIENLDIPLSVVAVDIESRRQVVFQSGILWMAALASIAIPGVYPPVRVGNMTLVDGGVLNPVPIDVAAAMGADRVVGVRLSGPVPTDRLEAVAGNAVRPRRSILQVLLRSIDAMQAAVNLTPTTVPSAVIEPRIPAAAGFPLRDFGQGVQYVEHGEAAAELAMDRLRALCPWLL